jgi:LemA protein
MRNVIVRNVAAMVLLGVATTGCNYNQLVAMKENVEGTWAQVENQLQRRNDLIPNLVEVTKGYATHEQEIFTRVADARARMLAGGTREEKIAAAGQLSSALGRLLAISERYPELKANQQFARLSDELAGTENRIAVERMRYNDVVRSYNAYIKSFPTMLYAGSLGFAPEAYFEVAEGAKQVPKVDFGTRPTTP